MKQKLMKIESDENLHEIHSQKWDDMKGARSWHFVQRRWWKIFSDISTKAEQIAQSFPSYNHKSSDAVNTGTLGRLVFLRTHHFLGHFTPSKCSCNMFEMGKCNKLESKRWEKLAIIQFPQLSLLSNYSIKIFSSCQNCLPKLFTPTHTPRSWA